MFCAVLYTRVATNDQSYRVGLRRRCGLDNRTHEPAKALELLRMSGVSLGIEQRRTAGPKAAERDPKQPIEARQNRSFPFWLERLELPPQGSIFDCDGSVTTHQEWTNRKIDRRKAGICPDCSSPPQ